MNETFDLKTKVLVTDDMLTMRSLVQKLLQKLGYSDVIIASNGAEAWKLLSEPGSQFGLVISDWNMPEMNGLELLKNVRADARLGKLPFIMLTSETEMSVVQEAIAAGLDGFIPKPFSLEIISANLKLTYKKVADRK
jgi:two-component system chemotaxis response regulator CheY